MAGNTHIIHRVNLEIDVPDVRLAHQLKDDALRLLNNEILPGLEKYLDTIELTNQHILFNHLNISLENLSGENFENEFPGIMLQAFREKVENEVASLPRQPEAEDVSVKYTGEQLALNSFLFFLETGRLPWWTEKSGEILKEENLSEILVKSIPEFHEQLVNLLRSNTMAFERLLSQFSVDFIFDGIKIQKHYPKDQLKGELLRMLHHFTEEAGMKGFVLSAQLQNVTKEIVRQIFLHDELPSVQLLQAIFEKFSPRLNTHDRTELEELLVKMNLTIVSDVTVRHPETKFAQTETQPRETSKKLLEKPEEEGIFLKNAGLVLLYPFFESFFSDFDLLTKGQFNGTDSQTLAVHLLHYLATKEEFAAEYDLGMEKFLCNWDPELPMAKDVQISQAMKDESETLLSAAIRHWSVLKNTSPDGLREGFLQREGKLIMNDFQNRLIVENQGQDVLLSYLPWGYSVFKLPWMESPLYVEWQ
jgi:hypothetical protein